MTLLRFLFLLLPFFIFAQARNISLGSSLTASDDSSPWQSPSGEFAFGFRRIVNQDSFLLAIWFNKIPDKTIVWYANGDNPAPQGSKIELTTDGHFKLTGPRGQEIWPETTVDDVSYAAMLDTGNFVLANKDSTYVWESFRNPTNTILPTQVLGIGAKLSSQQTENNYSMGRFQLRLKTDGDLVLNPIALLTEFAYQPYFRSNTSGAADEMNSGYQLEFNQTGYLNVVLRNRNLIALTKKIAIPSGEYYYRATLDSDGIFMQYAHPKTKKNGSWVHNWFPVWFVPQDVCSDINGDAGSGPCGFNSYCRLDENRRPICDCLPGFSLYDPNKKFHGCKQDTMQNCEPISSKPEDFYRMEELPNAYWPTSANYEQLQPLNEDDCSKSCLYDCNCVVAVIKEGSCWKKKLPLTNGRQDYNTYGKALIKVAKSNVSLDENSAGSSKIEKKDQTTLILAGALLLGSSVFLNLLFVAAISLVAFFIYQKIKKRNGSRSILGTNLCSFTYKELTESTNEFREELGRGAFGIVYKGFISSSSTRNYVAVKKLDRMVEEGEKEFQAEVSAIGQTHHRNLVRLLGFCDEGRNKLLVYEFMSNGTLASYLFGISRPDWNKRIQLAFGIARGLTYLHEECSKQIIHCDIKPQNILLDETFTAISDFGLAKLLMNDQTRTLTAIRGTRGYVAPEWFRNMPITAKVDVYSFGVMLLEIICCRKSLEMEREKEEEVILTDWVYDCYKENKLNVLVENDEEAKNDMKRLQRVVMVAIWCIQEDPSLRPSMRIVTQMIEGIVQVSVPPCPTPFASIC